MAQKTRTIALTLLGQTTRQDAESGDRVLFHRDRRPIRRAMLVVLPGEAPYKLRSRLKDTIVQLAGGPVVGSGDMAARILEGLRRDSDHAPICRGWTLAHIEDDSATDPYAPLSPRLTLVHSPTHRPSRARRRPGRWRLAKPAEHSPMPQVAYSLQ